MAPLSVHSLSKPMRFHPSSLSLEPLLFNYADYDVAHPLFLCRSKMRHAPNSPVNRALHPNRLRRWRNLFTKSRVNYQPSIETKSTSVHVRIGILARLRAPSRGYSILAWSRAGWWSVWLACRFSLWGSFFRGRGKVSPLFFFTRWRRKEREVMNMLTYGLRRLCLMGLLTALRLRMHFSSTSTLWLVSIQLAIVLLRYIEYPHARSQKFLGPPTLKSPGSFNNFST